MTPIRRTAAAASLALALSMTGVATAGDANLDLSLGLVSLEEDDWRPLEDQLSIGVETTWGDRLWPVRIAADLHFSEDDESLTGVGFEGRTLELALGVRRSFLRNREIQPFAGLGLATVDAEVEGTGFGQTASADDRGVGFWIGGGFRWRVSSGFTAGLSARWSDVEVTLPFAAGGAVDGQAGGLRYGILLGWTLDKKR